jgi:ribosome-associated protein
MKEFKLNGSPFVALCDLLKLVDITSSGAEAKHLIAAGTVTVDGQQETRKRCKITNGQVVRYGQHEIKVVS